MPKLDLSNTKKAMAWSLAILAGLAATYAALMLWMVVGVLTHVIAMCSGAPHWWDVTYMWLTLLVFVPGFCAGRGTYRWYIARAKDRIRDED